MKIKRIFQKVIATACAASMVFTGLVSDLGMLEAKAAAEHTLWVVGDSTVCEFSDSYYYPRYGYGTQLSNYLDGTYEVRNLALSGTSSKSFTKEANYDTLTSGIQAGDTLVIGFGHNDEKAEDADRYTSPIGDYTAEGSFAKSLYDNYISMAKSKGAEVILCTPIVRRTATTGSWSNNQLHVANGGDYAQVIRDLGTAQSVPVVDLTTLTKNLYDEIGAAETLYLHAWNSSKEGSVDNTHLNIYGAKKVAWLFANAVDDTTATLASHISLAAGEPTRANDLTPNPNYVELEYDGELPQSELYEDYILSGGSNGDGDDVTGTGDGDDVTGTNDGEDIVFKGTAFGNIGGQASTSNHIAETDANGNMHLKVQNNKGKIASNSDGIVMYYYKVPVGCNFKLSAKATLNSIADDNQAAFGLMARDDMYIDEYIATLASDYVVAGTLGKGCNCFYRKSGKLGGKAALTTETIEAGKTYDLSIVSNSDGYTCTFGNEPAQSAGYDFALTTVDSEYVYIGMFAARNADVTFSDISLWVEKAYEIEVISAGNGTAKADKPRAKEGDTVTLTATPDEGYCFEKWSIESDVSVEIKDNQFVMPACDVKVTASFVVDPNAPADGDDKDGNDKGTTDGDDKDTTDGDDKGTGDGDDKPVVNTEGFKVRLANPDAKYVYTGSAINPAIVVTNNGERLVAGVDYTVKYTNNVNTSVNAKKLPTITVTGKGNIAGATSTTFEIAQKDIADSDIVEGSVVVAKGSKATPILLYNNKLLGKKDFTNADAAKKFDADGTITITGQGNFTGSRTIAVKAVDKKDLKKLAVTVGKEKLTYNGKEQVPTITVTDKKDKTVTLKEGIDYIIVYGGNKANAGTVKFTVVGLGYYSGTVAKSYKIKPLAVKDISQMEVTGVNADGYEFLSKGVTIGDDLKVTYKAMNVVLTEGKDYKISYSANKKVGTAKYTVKFQGNFKGSKPVSGTFKIVAAPLSNATAKVVLPDQIYKGKPNVYKSKPIVDVAGVTLKASNYTVKYYTDAEMTKEVGKDNKVSLAEGQAYATVYVKIVGKGNYAPKKDECATAEYRVYAKGVYNDLSKAKVTFVDANGNKTKNVAYTGNELTPAVKVECKVNGAWVTVPADQYVVSYTNNVNKGKMTVVVTGTGKDYAGSKTAKISIVAKSLKDILDLWK